MRQLRAIRLRARRTNDAENPHAYVMSAVAELQAAQASQHEAERIVGHAPRTRVPDPLRRRLMANAPSGVVDALLVLLDLPRAQNTTVTAAVDLLGVLASKETLAGVWMRHGTRMQGTDAVVAFFTALRDRGDDGAWVVDVLADRRRREREEASAARMRPERMRELAFGTTDPDTFRAILDRDDVPVTLLVELAHAGHAMAVADHPKLPVDVVLDLARGRDYIVAALAMESRSMPSDKFAEFADHEAEIVRLAIAERAQYDGDVPPEVVESMANDRSDRVRAAIEAWRVAMLSRN